MRRLAHVGVAHETFADEAGEDVAAREAQQENLRHLEDVKASASSLGLYPVALGYRPFDLKPEMPWMPKQRYGAMKESLPERGSMALDMMLMTATGQVSLDWADEADCVRKVVVSARLAPLLVALYANSPLVQGKPSGFLSFRSHVWTDVDNARCGFLPAMFDNSFSYRAYVEWGLDAPLLFLRRRGQYLRPKLTFRQLLSDGFEGKPATRGDWADHLSTLFPEVRMKKVIEIRSADSVNAAMTGALAALWREIRDATAPLAGGGARKLGGWLADLSRVLCRLGPLAGVEGGEPLLDALWISRNPWEGSAHEQVIGATRLRPDEFLAWVDATLEGAQFSPQEDAQAAVVITPMARALPCSPWRWT